MDLAVVGSLNMDWSVAVARLPEPGETVLGTGLLVNPGGKGANQAVAAARLGGRVSMVGAVGTDGVAEELRSFLEAEGVSTDHIVRADGPSGAAFISVAADGMNTIVVAPGANATLTAAAVEGHPEATVTLAQLETTVAAVAAAAELGGTFVLNPAPAQPIPGEILQAVDVLVPNETELGVLTGEQPPETVREAVRLATDLPVDVVVVTMGAQGAVLVSGGDSALFPAPDVEAVDTTAAGDALCGALALAMARGMELTEAVRFGVAAGSAATTKRGAARSLPTATEVEALLT